MIKESYVSFETAKLLKEAGFDAPCYAQYSERGVQWDASYPENFNADDWGYSCPTQALAARWLREARHYVIYAWLAIEEKKWFYAYGYTDDMFLTYDYAISDAIYDTYEEAMEAGLKNCLELINNRISNIKES